MKRRHVVGMIAGAAAGAAALPPAAQAEEHDDRVDESLTFDPEGYTLQTRTVTTDGGTKEVTYRYWEAVTYVALPVDERHQSLNVFEPVEIDGAAVDASNAPILLENRIGGYMPSPIDRAVPGTNGDHALAAGFVVVCPAARGRTLVDDDGVYYGKAPAAIVDLKAAVRYLRYNRRRVPGNTERIVSTGVSAGGALSSLLGASTDNRAYDSYLEEIGAAPASDSIFATAAYCPITDLEHADMAHEWAYGTSPLRNGQQVDQEVSRELAAAFPAYQRSLKLKGELRRGNLTTDKLPEYISEQYLFPAATAAIGAMNDTDRTAYLAERPWITWSGGEATFA